MIDIIEFKKQKYPKFQSEGFAAQFAIPYAKHVCKGRGVDIGCGKPEWAFPGADVVDFRISYEFHAFELPEQNYDYIFSSHLLEHLAEWVKAVKYWTECLKPQGVLFLYLPAYSQEYWRPWNDTKHKSIIAPEAIRDYMIHLGYKNIFLSGVDLNNSFMIFGEKEVSNNK
jgi:predicted SAM-dependent methyltransferase